MAERKWDEFRVWRSYSPSSTADSSAQDLRRAEMTFESQLIAWSIRLSMLLFVTTLFIRLVAPKAISRSTTLKALWTTGFALYVVHVLAAFHFVHQWSHWAAYRATAKQTLVLLGVEFGGGVYFNYLFLLAWVGDVLHAWFPAPRQQWLLHWLLRIGLVYMLFIAFNGIVIFKSGWLRMVGIGATAILLAVFLLSRTISYRSPAPRTLAECSDLQ